MSQSLNNISVHLVFSTKNREPVLRDKERSAMHAFICGVVKNHRSHVIEVNSVSDHVHILYVQPRSFAPAKVIEQVKCSSSLWLKKQDSWYERFAWQKGYGAFSVSHAHVDAVRNYIKRQQEHHKVASFQMEFQRVCAANGISIANNFSWD